jgi:hypothetical protein
MNLEVESRKKNLTERLEIARFAEGKPSPAGYLSAALASVFGPKGAF